MSIDLTKKVIFDSSIVISNSNETQDSVGNKGQLRFNKTTLKFEGYHGSDGADIFGNIWRPLTQEVASATNLGIVRIGNNLTINPATGVLSSETDTAPLCCFNLIAFASIVLVSILNVTNYNYMSCTSVRFYIC